MSGWLDETAAKILLATLIPVYDFLFSAGSRYYWIYCASGLIIAAYSYWRHKSWTSFQTTLLDKNVWLSPSAINDYIIMVATPVLRISILSFTIINAKPLTEFVTATLHSAGVSGSVNDANAAGLGIVLTLTLFLADDFFRFYLHYLFHRIPELWEFHKVHHSAEVLNFATSERHHPIELVMTAAFLTALYAVINGIFIAAFGDKVTVATIAGANIFLFVFNVCGGVLRHSPFWISFGPRVERWIISPAMHQIHHSEKLEHFDRNLGGALSVWDRMFGTLHIPKAGEVESFGIGAETAEYRSLAVIYFRPITAAAELFRKRFKSTSQSAVSASA